MVQNLSLLRPIGRDVHSRAGRSTGKACMPGSIAEARRALSLFPRGLYLLTACFDNKRAGQFVESVQPCAQEPLLIGTGGNWSRQIMECPQLVQRCRTAPRGFDTDMAAVAAYLAFDSLPRFR